MEEIRLNDLSLSFGDKQVLRDFSLTLAPGRVTALMGPSGSGKSTVMNLLLGLLRPDEGSVRIPAGTRISAVFQEDRLIGSLTVRANLRAVTGRSFSEEKAASLLAAFGLEPGEDGLPVLSETVSNLSGGMKRRVALARALLVPFDLLLLDEPFTGLDADTKDRVIRALRPLFAGKTVLLITHDPAEAKAFGATEKKLPA